MFMFRRRRTTNLTKKLLKRRRANLNGPPVPTAAAADSRGPQGPRDVKERDVQELLKKLQENQLEMLLTAVESRGFELGHCVLVSREFSDEPHVLCCQYWRWPDLRQASELRRLPQCGAAYDSVYACCNPYHWSRLCQPEIPPPPYSRTNEDRIRPEDRAPSELPLLTRNSYESLTTNGDSSMANPLEWCKLAYWELQERVGSLFPVEPCSVNVFGNVPYGLDGLSLEALGPQNAKATDASQRTRAKIGLGVTLSREPGGTVWLYNRSEQPVFVHSLYLEGGAMLGGCEPPGGPVRVPTDHCLCVHAPGGPQMFGWDNLVGCHQQGPAGDPNSIRISFVKGWGSKYSRREITSCPCWLEILLAPCR